MQSPLVGEGGFQERVSVSPELHRFGGMSKPLFSFFLP